MKYLFLVWGGVGFFPNIINMLHIWGGGASVGNSSVFSATALIWIGGMIFFGLPSLMFRNDTRSDLLQSDFARGLTAKAE
jgi:hypothetical protein